MKKIFFTLLLSSLALGCASSAEKEVETQVSQEKPATAPGEVAGRGRDAIMNSKSLNEEQKKKIVDLMAKVQVENNTLKEETTKLKMTLFKSIAEGGYKAEQVNVMKSKLQKLENKKMDLMFSSLDQVKDILGVPDKNKQQDYSDIYRAMMW
jgi:Spy/CpxP family protein refolding chaperone